MAWNLSAFADEAGDSCVDQVKALTRDGYKFVDVRSVEGHNISALPLDTAREVRKQFNDAGIRIAMFGSPLGKIDIADDFEIDMKKLRHMGELAPIFDCKAIRIFSYYNKTSKPREQWKAESLRRLVALREQARKLGMVLYHENEAHIFGEKAEDILVLAKEVREGQAFKLIFDPANYTFCCENVWECWVKLRHCTDGFHLKDNNKEGQFLLLGQGVSFVREILADALKAGWQGPLTLEPHLIHSPAVLATGPGGKENKQFSGMTQPEMFHHAAVAAKTLLKEIGAPIA